MLIGTCVIVGANKRIQLLESCLLGTETRLQSGYLHFLHLQPTHIFTRQMWKAVGNYVHPYKKRERFDAGKVISETYLADLVCSDQEMCFNWEDRQDRTNYWSK